jgi:hypothetical protein
MLKRLTILLTFSILLIGCKTIVLHPLTDKDIRIESKSGTNWVCMSPEYVQNVMKARLGK